MRFEARIKNVPGQLWGVWDHETEEWRRTLLGTDDEGDARQSADLMNSMPEHYAFGVRMRIRRPPKTFLARTVVGIVLVVCAMQLWVPGNWHPAGPAAGFMLAVFGLGWAWWKLLMVERYTPDVLIVHSGLEPYDAGDEDGSPS
jgi:predicted phage tail protein